MIQVSADSEISSFILPSCSFIMQGRIDGEHRGREGPCRVFCNSLLINVIPILKNWHGSGFSLEPWCQPVALHQESAS
jgi:hypothetical protein